MSTSDYCLIIIVVFFVLFFHSCHVEDKRRSDRRQQSLPHPVERRVRDRRGGWNTMAHAKWVARSIWPKAFRK